jgi:hypothetical protein
MPDQPKRTFVASANSTQIAAVVQTNSELVLAKNGVIDANTTNIGTTWTIGMVGRRGRRMEEETVSVVVEVTVIMP